MKKYAVLLATVLIAGHPGVADAATLLDLDVVDRSNGQTLEVYRHRGRLYVVGTPGNRYAVVLRNKTAGRLLTVLSVDGVNALNGQTAATTQSGYVLPAWQSAEIAGWRKSMDDVAAFYFTNVADSYAGRTDRPQNVGVIGVAVYREAVPLPPSSPPVVMSPRAHDSEKMAESAAPASAPLRPRETGADHPLSARAEKRLGTGHGERIDSPTQYTDFRRTADTPTEIVAIYYDSYANLLAKGVIPPSRPPASPLPNPFPGGFTPDPRR